MRPLIIESNSRILLETQADGFLEAKEKISSFLELVKSLNVFHIYAVTRVSLWNGFTKGINYTTIKKILENYSKYPLPSKVLSFIKESFENFNLIKITTYDEKHDLIESKKPQELKEIIQNLESEIKDAIQIKHDKIILANKARGIFKSNMINLGYPVNDFTKFIDGDPLVLTLKKDKLTLRQYQQEAKEAFLEESKYGKGAMGLIILPCGAGKTIVGIAILAALKMTTLIITPNVVALRQWKKELLEKTTIKEDDIGEYSGIVKEIKKITLTTYQILTYRKNRESDFHHLFLFQKKNWGLIIYDEIHMLPAKVFRYVASVQSKRRLGLTATLVREDGNEKQVFSLVGPKKYDVFWKDLEKINFLAKVSCFEVKVDMGEEILNEYYNTSSEKEKYKLASINPQKTRLVEKIINKFKSHQIIIIGHYLDQLEIIAEKFQAPLLTGKTNYLTRQKIYSQFNQGKINLIVVSKIANFAIDLPNAEVAIQVSGTFGSRQEEAQRLGRIIRPKNKGSNEAYFISLVTRYTREEILSQNRKGFLTTQGYTYQVKYEENLNFNDEK